VEIRSTEKDGTQGGDNRDRIGRPINCVQNREYRMDFVSAEKKASALERERKVVPAKHFLEKIDVRCSGKEESDVPRPRRSQFVCFLIQHASFSAVEELAEIRSDRLRLQ